MIRRVFLERLAKAAAVVPLMAAGAVPLPERRRVAAVRRGEACEFGLVDEHTYGSTTHSRFACEVPEHQGRDLAHGAAPRSGCLDQTSGETVRIRYESRGRIT